MKKLFLVIVIATLMVCSVSALSVEFGPDPWGVLTDSLKSELKSKIAEKYGKYEHGEDLGRGLANANALAADSGYMKGAWGYEHFTASVSCNGGFVLDGMSFNNFNDDFLDEYKEKGDKYMGAALQMINASVGFNLGHLLGWNHGLYVTLKAGMSKLDIKDLDFDSYNFGFMLNYQLLRERNLAKCFTWRGLNVGAGLNYYNSTLGWTLTDMEDIRVKTAGSDYVEYSADLDVEATNSSFVVPLEISTGFKASIFELYGGLGADFQFGGDNKIDAEHKNDDSYE